MTFSNPTTLKGIITPFEGNGRKLGYPTANINADTDLEDGVYFGFADLKEYSNQPALLFIGTPITLKAEQRRIEAHLLDIPDQNYYGEKITLRIIKFHRPNKKFESVDSLLAAMNNDEHQARKWFKAH